ncbi:porin [Rhizobium sp. 25PS6]|nr:MULTISPECIES: porin [Rhizobium]MBY3234067.1 porin [Rhizobium laguerreae]MDU0307749.1 porin [Rhizobium sp. 10PS4]MDU0360224.1 porin [Rhizobium sp. 25PS6]
MNIRMVLLASAAAFAASTPVLAADAIVAAEPEPVEYVRVCDAYGTGYFYIPGTETCLKIEGYIRFQVNVGDQPGGDNDSDWDAVTRGQVQFTAKSDTEYGPLTGVIVMQFNADNATDQDAILDSAYLDVAGFRAGLFYSWWDDGLSGETDDIGSVVTLHNSLRYQYESGTFYAGLSVDELEDGVYQGTVDPVTGDFTADDGPNNVGVAFGVGGTAGAFSYQVTGGWDFDNEDGAIRAMGTVEIGPGTLGLAGVYSSGPNSYYSSAEWAVAAEYAIKATDKLKITPAVQYYGNYFGGGTEVPEDFDGLGDAWKVGLTVDYQIVDNFYAKASVQYLDPDDGEDSTSGYFRLQRSF